MNGAWRSKDIDRHNSLAVEHKVALSTLHRYIAAAFNPDAVAQLSAEDVEGTALRLARHYGKSESDADEVALAERHRHAHFAPLALFEIYINRNDVALPDAVVSKFAAQACEFVATARAERPPVGTAGKKQLQIVRENILAFQKCCGKERNLKIALGFHRLSDDVHIALKSEGQRLGIRWRPGILSDNHMDLRAVAAATSPSTAHRGRPSNLKRLGDDLSRARHRAESEQAWARAGWRARRDAELKSPALVTALDVGSLDVDALLAVAKSFSNRRGRRPLACRAAAQAVICHHYLALTGLAVPDWFKREGSYLDGPYFHFLNRVDEAYKTTLSQTLMG